MSDVAQRARLIADRLLPHERGTAPPSRERVDEAIEELRALTPVDHDDRTALAEAGETVLLLRDSLPDERGD